MKGACDDEICDALLLLLDKEAVLGVDSESEASGAMAADRRLGAPLLA